MHEINEKLLRFSQLHLTCTFGIAENGNIYFFSDLSDLFSNIEFWYLAELEYESYHPTSSADYFHFKMKSYSKELKLAPIQRNGCTLIDVKFVDSTARTPGYFTGWMVKYFDKNKVLQNKNFPNRLGYLSFKEVIDHFDSIK